MKRALLVLAALLASASAFPQGTAPAPPNCADKIFVERSNGIGDFLDAELRQRGYGVVERAEDARFIFRVVPDSKATSMTPGGTVLVVDRGTGKVVWEKRRKNWYWTSGAKRTARKLAESFVSEFKCSEKTP